MHRLGDVVDVRLVEAQPVAGALRFELLSEGQAAPRGTGDRFGRSDRRVKDRTHRAKFEKQPAKKRNKMRKPERKTKPGKRKKGKP
jgi:ribonuclease R